MKNWIVNNLWIKVLSLILAIITWFMVNSELEKEKRFSNRFYNSALYKSYLMEDSKERPSAQKTKGNRGYVTEEK